MDKKTLMNPESTGYSPKKYLTPNDRYAAAADILEEPDIGLIPAK